MADNVRSLVTGTRLEIHVVLGFTSWNFTSPIASHSWYYHPYYCTLGHANNSRKTHAVFRSTSRYMYDSMGNILLRYHYMHKYCERMSKLITTVICGSESGLTIIP